MAPHGADYRKPSRRLRPGARRRRHRRGRGGRDRPPARQGRARRSGRRRGPGPRCTPPSRRADRGRHPGAPGCPGCAAPRHGPRARHRRARPVARDQGLDRAGDRRRLLLRLRVPGRVSALRVRPRAHRGAHGRPRRGQRAVRALGAPRLGGDRALQGRGPALQGRADLRPGAGRGRRERVPVSERPVRGPVPGSARAVHRPDQGLQAQLGRRRLLAGRREPPDAHPHLRDGVLLRGGPRRAPGAARAGARPRPPATRPAPRAVQRPARRARDAVLAAQRNGSPATGGARGAAASGCRRLRGDQDPAGAGRGALAPLRALGQLRGEHVLHGGSRAGGSP